MVRSRTHLLLALATVCAILAGTAASAGESYSPRAVKKNGSCSGPTNWTLVLRQGDPGKLIVIFSAQGGPSGQRWTIFISDTASGTTYQVYAGNRTSGTGGSFRVRKVTKNRAGTDHISVGASAAKGEICNARASI